jgi:MFS family permease
VVVAMTTILSKVLFPPSTTPLLAAFAVVLSYSLTLIFRPVGAAIFGHLGDKIGRRYAMMITIGGIGVSAALVGVLPTYAQAGLVSYILFVILRMCLGAFYGGEYAGGWTYVIEWTPPKWRGLASAFAQGGYAMGLFIAGIVVAGLSGLLGDAAMIDYGWRYIFLAGVFPVAVALGIRYSMRESPIFLSLKSGGKVEKAPFFSLFKKPAVYALIQVAVIMTGMLLFYSGTYYITTLLTSPPAMVGSGLAALLFSVWGLGQLIMTFVYGQLSQIVGRRRLGMLWAALGFVIAIPIYYGLIQAAIVVDVLTLTVLAFVMGGFVQGPYGGIAAYLAERFKTSHRASGVGFGYTTGYFIAAWYSLYVPALHSGLQGIESPTNIWLSVAVLCMIGAAIFGFGYYLGPETVGKKLTEE